MLKNILSRVIQRNSVLAGNAVLVKLGDLAYTLFVNSTKEKLPKELKGLVDTPLAQVMGTNAVLGISGGYGIVANEGVANSLAFAAWDKFIMSIGKEKAAEIEAAYIAEVIKVDPSHNTALGAVTVIHGKAGDYFAKSAAESAAVFNTAQGGTNEVELTEQGDDVPDDGADYMPKSVNDLKKNEKNLYICPDPLKIGDGHAKQKDKFRPWNAREGFMPEYKDVVCCGGCCEKMTGMALVEKKKAENAAKVDEEKGKKRAVLIAKENDLKLLNEQLTKKLSTEATFMALVKEDPSNEDTAEALKNIQISVSDLKKKIDDVTLEIMALDEEINGAPGNKAEPTKPEAKPEPKVEVKPAPTVTPAANTSKGNAKQNTSAAARLEHLKNQQKNKK